MNNVIKASLACMAILGLVVVNASEYGSFQQIETETFDKEEFVFPDNFKGAALNVIFLSMSEDQDNGQYQGEVLLDWQAALDERNFFSDQIVGYHFAVIKAPFFIKGVIRNAMRENYEDKVPLDQSGILFISDLEEFADAAGLAIDNQATIVFVSPDGELLQVFKGEASEQSLDELLQAAAEISGSHSPPAG
jgi:hypothetical protein